MGKRPSKSTSLKLLQGARVTRREIEAEPKPRPIAPKAMKGLSAADKRTYDQLAKQLARIGLAGECDGGILSTLVKVQNDLVYIWSKVQRSKRMVKAAEKSGDVLVIEAADKELLRWMRQQRQYSESFRRIAAELGLSPRGRTGLKVELGGADDGEDLLTKPISN